LKVTFLGTGTSQGVPVIACNCKVCTSDNEKDKRLRSSIMFEIDDKVIVVDSGPDFRQQMLREKVKNLTAIVFTHEHKDHVAGLDDVRAFNFILKKPIDIYCEKRVQHSLKREFAYVFAEDKYPGIPQINMHTIDENKFLVNGVEIQPIRGIHYKLPVLGFRIGNCAYLTDMSELPAEEYEKLKGLDALIITALRKEEHLSHFNLKKALAVAARVEARNTFLTHLSHQFGLYDEESAKLPPTVYLAYDGLKLTF
jgi:phosphoribosyl 1,2-cyclic phosphate phosphodiesterase